MELALGYPLVQDFFSLEQEKGAIGAFSGQIQRFLKLRSGECQYGSI